MFLQNTSEKLQRNCDIQGIVFLFSELVTEFQLHLEICVLQESSKRKKKLLAPVGGTNIRSNKQNEKNSFY